MTKVLVSPIGSATIVIKIGPDGCLYVQDNRSTLRVSNAAGLCNLSGNSSDVAAYVPTPAQVSWSLRNIAQSWFWVAVLIVLLGAASTLFNSTLDANYTEIVGWFAPLRRRFSRKAVAQSETNGPTTWRGWKGLTIYLVLAGVVYTLRSPSFSTFAGFAVGIGAGSLIGMEATRRRVARRQHKVGQPIAMPSTLLVAGAFLAISALASARPGYVFGIVIGMAFVPALDKRETGLYSAFGAALALGIGIGAWLLRWPLAYGLDAHPAGIHRFVADVLAVIFVSSVCTIAFGMTPLRFLPGEQVRAWHQVAWIALWALGLFALVQILESGYGYASAAQERSPTVILGVALLVVAVAFWGYFRRRDESAHSTPRGEGGEPNRAEDAVEPAPAEDPVEPVAVVVGQEATAPTQTSGEIGESPPAPEA